MRTLLNFFLALLFLNSVVLSQTKVEFKPEVKVGATIFTGWEFNINNTNFITKLDSARPNGSSAFGYDPVKHQFEISQNSFFLERAYLNAFASITPSLKGRLTSDVFSITDGIGKTQYELGIKFAWIDWTAYKNESGLAVDLVVGVIPNNWVPLNDKYFGYRGFSKTLSDYQWTVSAVKNTTSFGGIYNVLRTTGSYFSSADLGANLTMTFPNSLGELYLNVMNGNGFRNLGFDNRFKDFQIIGVVHPLANQINKKIQKAKSIGINRIDGITDLTFGGFSYLGKLGLGENYAVNGVQYKRNRFGGMWHVRYNFKKFGFFKVGGEYSIQSNQDPSAARPDSASEVTSTGLSVYLEFNPPLEVLNDKLMLIGRYDTFDPNTSETVSSSIGFNNNTDKQNLLLMGIAYKPSSFVTLGASYQQTGYQLPFIVKYDGTPTDTYSRFFLHGILEF